MATSKISTIVTSQGTLYKETQTISNVERAVYTRHGNVVIVDLIFTVGSAIGTDEPLKQLFGGAPENYNSNTRFRCASSNHFEIPLVLAITSTGEIINQYSPNGIPVGVYQASFTYICK